MQTPKNKFKAPMEQSQWSQFMHFTIVEHMVGQFIVQNINCDDIHGLCYFELLGSC
jgi:hypothetical protein